LFPNLPETSRFSGKRESADVVALAVDRLVAMALVVSLLLGGAIAGLMLALVAHEY